MHIVLTRHSYSRNSAGYVGRGGSRSQETIHHYSINRVTRGDVEGRGGYSSPTSHYHFHNQGESVILLDFSGGTVGGNGRFRYRSQTSHSSSKILDIRGDGTRHEIRSEDINHSSLFNFGESVNGGRRSVSRSNTIPSPYHNSGDIGISSVLIATGITEVDIGLIPDNFVHITMVG